MTLEGDIEYKGTKVRNTSVITKTFTLQIKGI